MSAPDPLPALVEGCARALVELGASNPRLAVVDAAPASHSPALRFGQRFPDRYTAIGPTDPALLANAARRSVDGSPVFVCVPSVHAVGPAYAELRTKIAGPRSPVKLIALHGGADASPVDPLPMLEDLGVMRGVPGMTVAAPADGPTAEGAVRAVAAHSGPAYVRISREELPPIPNDEFRIGHASIVRDGSDLGVVAVGAMVARALDLAGELARVGVSARVLDLASVKPYDEPALLRAARDTGAILVAEEHSVVSGVGALVASVTAENYPVPVRRVGLPDVFDSPGSAASATSLATGRLADEAWELLRLRGKVE